MINAGRGYLQQAPWIVFAPGAALFVTVTLDAMGATLRYHDLTEGAFDVGSVRVVTRYLNHPALALGYRLEADGVAVVYATDHEPHSRHQAGRPVHEEDRHHIDFLAGADLIIHDAQYTEAEYPTKTAWGHTCAEHAVDFAVAAGARRLALFHHDLDLLPIPTPAATTAPPATILVVDDEAEVMTVLVEALTLPGFRVLTATDGDAALAVARAERPDLILLDWMLPKLSGLEVCRTLRSEADPRLRAVPIVLLTANTEAADTAAGFAAGATDYVIKPFKLAHVRSRVEAWLLRRGAI